MAKLQKQWPEMVHQAADLPDLLKKVLTQQAEGQAAVQMRSEELAQLAAISRHNQRQLFFMVIGFTAGISAGIFHLLSNHPVWSYALAAVSVAAFLFAWPRRRP
jgi:ubiquinone biosynthesis protein